MFKTGDEILHWESLIKATQPLFPMCKLLGILPYGDDFLISRFWLKYSIILDLTIIIIVSTLKAVLAFIYQPRWLPGVFTKLLFLTEGVIEGAGLTAHLISLVKCRPIFDKVLIGLRDLPDHKTNHLFSKIGPLVCIILMFLTYAKHLYNYGTQFEISTYLFYVVNMATFTYNCIHLQFCCVLEFFRHHLNILTEELHPNHEKLVLLTKRHHFLIDLAASLNEIFSWQLLIICMRIFLRLVSSLYVCILKLRESDVLEVLDKGWICIWQIILLFSLAICCEATKDKVENFNNELFKLMRENKELCNNEKLYFYVTMKQTVNFTACGFFTLGYPMVTSIIAAATTYLVILVQFSLQDQ